MHKNHLVHKTVKEPSEAGLQRLCHPIGDGVEKMVRATAYSPVQYVRKAFGTWGN